MVVVPDVAGSKPTVLDVSPLLKIRLPTIVPTVVLELVIGTLTSDDIPPRRSCAAETLSVTGSRRAGSTVTVVFVADAVVAKFPGEEIWKPDGSTVTVMVALR